MMRDMITVKEKLDFKENFEEMRRNLFKEAEANFHFQRKVALSHQRRALKRKLGLKLYAIKQFVLHGQRVIC